MTAPTWTLDPTHSSISFAVRHMVFAKVRGRFSTFAGTIAPDASDLEHATIQATIDTTSIDTGVSDRDAHLRSADFFDVEQFPHMRFESTRIVDNGSGRFTIHGALTIKDVTHDVALDATFGGQAQDPWGNTRVAFSATTSIDRRDFGLTWNQVLEAGGVLVGERIDIELDVQAVQAAASDADSDAAAAVA
mgnify:CR=1 FL=1